MIRHSETDPPAQERAICSSSSRRSASLAIFSFTSSRCRTAICVTSSHGLSGSSLSASSDRISWVSNPRRAAARSCPSDRPAWSHAHCSVGARAAVHAGRSAVRLLVQSASGSTALRPGGFNRPAGMIRRQDRGGVRGGAGPPSTLPMRSSLPACCCSSFFPIQPDPKSATPRAVPRRPSQGNEGATRTKLRYHRGAAQSSLRLCPPHLRRSRLRFLRGAAPAPPHHLHARPASSRLIL